MKRKILLLIFVNLFIGLTIVNAQCTPGDTTSCPDPDNNGQICPSVLPLGYKGVSYSEEVTILPPPEIDVSGTMVPLYKIVVTEIQNLPPGLSDTSNSPGNEFLSGNYYCFLISGTPTSVGSYQLKIKADIFINVFGNPVYATEHIDSTSLSMNITWDPNSIQGKQAKEFSLLKVQPNPFSYSTKIGFNTPEPCLTSLKIFDMQGKLIYTENINAGSGENYFDFNGRKLNNGLYFFTVSNNNKAFSERLLKIN